ncbi:hypothetical protein [Aeromonas dhakensis]|uniref:hypothetical protein n=1 Tax=Aeromonas dhakensis TaxID=196024 RepID=UPI00244D5173|nr:hypothetical protein [Aeromonas dhakensis]MDH0348192.1 hypothetical protein [Aeromonas dhakensis]
MKEPQEQVATDEKEALPQGTEQGIEQEVDQETMLRMAVAHNYLQHCVNAAQAAKGADETPSDATLTGHRQAIVSLLMTMLQVQPEHNHIVLEVLAGALGDISVSEKPLPEVLMEQWVVSQARQGRMNALLGRLRDCAELDRNMYAHQQAQQLKGKIEEISQAKGGGKRQPAAKKTKGETASA